MRQLSLKNHHHKFIFKLRAFNELERKLNIQNFQAFVNRKQFEVPYFVISQTENRTKNGSRGL